MSEDINLNESIVRLINSSAKFSDLVDLVGLDPDTDFRNVDLTGVDFGSSDLTEFRFQGSVLDSCDLSRCLINAQTLAGVISKRGILLPRIAYDAGGGVSLTVTLPYQHEIALERTFGSIRRAIIETLAVSKLVDKNQLTESLKTLIMSGLAGYGDGDKKTSVKVPNLEYGHLRQIASSVGTPLTATMRMLLRMTVDAIGESGDQFSERDEFTDHFARSIKAVRSDAPEQGFLF